MQQTSQTKISTHQVLRTKSAHNKFHDQNKCHEEKNQRTNFTRKKINMQQDSTTKISTQQAPRTTISKQQKP